MCFSKPNIWEQWLSLAEFWYNSSHHSAIQCSPFEAMYGYAPLLIPGLKEEQSSVAVVADLIIRQAQMMRILKENLQKAQNRMKV